MVKRHTKPIATHRESDRATRFRIPDILTGVACRFIRSPLLAARSLGNRVFDGPLKEVQIIEVATSSGGALSGSFEVSFQGHSVGIDVGASLAVVEVSLAYPRRLPIPLHCRYVLQRAARCVPDFVFLREVQHRHITFGYEGPGLAQVNTLAASAPTVCVRTNSLRVVWLS